METDRINRRKFLGRASGGLAATAAATVAGTGFLGSNVARGASVPALLGGTPVRTKGWPSWPVYDESDVKMFLDAYRSNNWCRIDGEGAVKFEGKYAELMGVPRCVLTNAGTTALNTSLNVLGVGPGDEVIVPPYTFVATVQVVFQVHALGVFVDIDPETHQIDPSKIEERITEHTKAILPVHIGGGASDLDRITAIGQKHGIPVLEDACQAWMGEWNGKKLGSVGTLGCFSFQASKNLNSGEGGAIIGSDPALMDMAASYTNNGRPAGEQRATLTGYPNSGSNHRMTEFQAAVLLGQMQRLEEQTALRNHNGAYLDGLLSEIPGIAAAGRYEGQNRHAYHLYMMNYDAERFNGLPKAKFARALRAEGIATISTGYGLPPLNKQGFIEKKLNSRHYKAVYSKERLDKYRDENECPNNDKLCGETGLWFYQSILLGTEADMRDIAEAIIKIQQNSKKLV
ncbi:DegT/DnrJ/EryC1/StrS family aminotransferase [candidate division KSB1 bacterium]